MERTSNLVTCHWLTPTRLMGDPYTFEAEVRPWTCLRDGCPRPLSMTELHDCASCARWEPRTFESARRDLIFETWGPGDMAPRHRTYDEARREAVAETWGVESPVIH